MKTGVKVPEKRISIVEKNKEKLKKKTNVEINVKRGSVEIEGESLKVWKAKNIIEAIGKGFSLEKSLKLLSEEIQLKIVHLKDLASSRSLVNKIKGRIIGKDGRTRELIEKYSKGLVSVGKDDVSIIGKPKEIEIASEAMKMLINGKPHAKVYHYLEQNQPGGNIR